MTPSELKFQIESNNPDTHFFDRKTMQFFGDTMRNYGVRQATITTYLGETVDAWELYRKRPVKCNNRKSAYFSRSTLKQVFPKQED